MSEPFRRMCAEEWAEQFPGIPYNAGYCRTKDGFWYRPMNAGAIMRTVGEVLLISALVLGLFSFTMWAVYG